MKLGREEEKMIRISRSFWKEEVVYLCERETREERREGSYGVFVSSTKLCLSCGLGSIAAIHDSRRRALRCAVFVAH